MKALRIVFRLGLLIGLATEIPALPATAQTTSPKETQPPAPGLRKLTGDDAKRAEELDKAIEAALKADRWDEAIAQGRGTARLAARLQGPKHFETVNAEWRLKACAGWPRCRSEDRAAYLSAKTMNGQAEALYTQGKYAQAQPLFEKALEIRRRLLTDDHPDTAESYDNVAYNLNAQGKYAAAQPLFEKALEIRRRLLTDDHPDTAISYNNVAYNLDAQGKYARPSRSTRRRWRSAAASSATTIPTPPLATTTWRTTSTRRGSTPAGPAALREGAGDPTVDLLTDDHPHTATSYNNLAANLTPRGSTPQAQPLFEKALEIRRRLLTDDHPSPPLSYNNLAGNLNAQGKYAAAQPLFEKALEIRRRLLTDDHPDTAASYNNLADNLKRRGSTPAAQPLYEKALEIRRHSSPTTTPTPPSSYNNLAINLHAQGKYAAAQPLYEKALEIYRRLVTETTPTPPSLQQPGDEPPRPGEIRGGPAALREGAGDPPPPAHRRPPRTATS